MNLIDFFNDVLAWKAVGHVAVRSADEEDRDAGARLRENGAGVTLALH